MAVAAEVAAPAIEEVGGSLLSRIGLGRLGGVLKDFNDNPVGKLLGSSFGRTVAGHVAGSELTQGLGSAAHTISQGAVGVGEPASTHGVNIGPMGNI
jgi:hypothetical protein